MEQYGHHESGSVCVVCVRPAVVEITGMTLCSRHGLFALIDKSLSRGNRTVSEWRDNLAKADATPSTVGMDQP